MINISEWVQDVKSTKKNADNEISEELLEEFKDALISKISELYQEGYEFKHNPKSEYCQHCGK
jgi:hypothetical protein